MKVIKIKRTQFEKIFTEYVKRYMVSEALAGRNWKITRCGKRGIEISVVDKRYINYKAKKQIDRQRRRHGL